MDDLDAAVDDADVTVCQRERHQLHVQVGVTKNPGRDGTGQRRDVPSRPVTKIRDETANAYTDIGR